MTSRAPRPPGGVLVCTALLLLLSGPVGAGLSSGSFSDAGVGARTFGLGGAFSAVADDPYAIAFNPAGLAYQERPAVAFDYANLFGLDLLKQSYFAGVLPWGDFVHGASYRNLSVSFDPFPQTLSEGTFSYALSRRFGQLGVGGTIKYFSLTSDFTQGTATGYGVDVGLLYRLSDRLTIGGSVADLASNLEFGTGTNEQIAQLFRAGVAFRRDARWLVTADFAGERGQFLKELRFGTEYWLLNGDRTTADPLREEFFRSGRPRIPVSFAVRAGLEAELFDEGGITPGFGLSAGFEGLRFDYSYQFDAKEIGGTNRFSLVYAFANRFGEERSTRDPTVTRDDRRPAAASLPHVAVATVQNASGDAGLAWLERGLQEVIARAILRSGAVEVAPLERVRGAEVLGGPVASRLGASHEMRGTFFRTTPGKIVLTVRILDDRGNLVEYYSLEAGDEDVFPLGDAAGAEAARRIAAGKPRAVVR